MPIHDPIFIVGSERSGTTLLRLMLTSHPSIAVPPEGDFLTRIRSDRPTDPQEQRAFIRAFLSIEKCREWGLSEAVLHDCIQLMQPRTWAELAAVPYWGWLATNFPSANRWGDKNPCHVHQIGYLMSLYPRAKFIHIIRDGRDVAASWLAAPFGPTTADRAAQQWSAAVQAGQDAAQASPGRVTQVFYEDLAREPEQTLTAICHFLGEDFSDQMMTYPSANRSQELVPQHRLAWHAKTLQAPDPSRIGQWRQRLTAEQVRAFEASAGELLRTLGYPDADTRAA